jgi:hypothetical protein
MNRIIIVLLILTSSLVADVKSTTGQIKFDTQMDNQAEMTLNSTGLGIGITPSTNLHVNGNAIITNQIFVGGSSGSSNFNVNGTIGYGFQTVSSNTDLGDSSIILADSSSDNITITLPYAGNVTGRQYQIKKISTPNSVWVSGGGNLIDDTSPIELPESSDLASVKLISNGSQWYKINQKNLNETIAYENLIGWWKLDERSGIIAHDSSRFSNNGSLTPINFSGNGTDGIHGRALRFDGSGDRIFLGDAINLSNNTSMTIMAWVKPEDATQQGYAISSWTSGQWTYNLIWTGSAYQFTVRGSDLSGKSSGGAAGSLGIWAHVTGVANAQTGTIKVYINGVGKATGGGWDGSWYSAGAAEYIGWKDDSNDSFTGEIDDVRVYNRTLTDAEIFSIFEGK